MWPAKYPWKYYAGDTMCEQLQLYLGDARGCVVSDCQHDVYILNWTGGREEDLVSGLLSRLFRVSQATAYFPRYLRDGEAPVDGNSRVAQIIHSANYCAGVPFITQKTLTTLVKCMECSCIIGNRKVSIHSHTNYSCLISIRVPRAAFMECLWFRHHKIASIF